MLKINFEKAVLFVLLLIILISTANIYSQYIALVLPGSGEVIEQSGIPADSSLSMALFEADKLYEEHKYQEAANGYYQLIWANKLGNVQQKALTNFKLGMCNFKLQKYDMARDSFIKSLDYSPNDAVVYNNAAISSYYIKDYKKALEYEQEAIKQMPVVEYYYNMGRIYETIEDYSSSAKYYAGVVRGEDNITYDDRIDPVRIKSKLNRILPDLKAQDRIANAVLIVLKLKDMREVLLINDTDPKVKGFDFELNVYKYGGSKTIKGSYDRMLNDPYNLIKSIDWTIRNDNKTMYKSGKDSMTYRTSSTKDCEVILHFIFNDGSEKSVSREILGDKPADVLVNKDTPPDEPDGPVCKTYAYASYEQLFDEDFKVSSGGYTDRFNVVWGEDNVEAKIMDKDYIDPGALYIKNNSVEDSGIWANLNSLLTDKKLRGRTIGIRFYARKITDDAQLDVMVRVKAEKIFNKPGSYKLDYKWQRIGMDVYIPENADGLTLSLDIKPGAEVKIDGFVITIIR